MRYICLFLLFSSSFLFAKESQLIPRHLLLKSTPERTAAHISPDGQTLAFLQLTEDKVLNVFVAPIDNLNEARQVTHFPKPSITDFHWAKSGKYLLFLGDHEGNALFHLYAIDLETQIVRDLTPFTKVRASNLILSKKDPHEVLVALNMKDPALPDLYRVRLDTGELKLDTENPGNAYIYYADAYDQVRAYVTGCNEEGNGTLYTRQTVHSPWKEVVSWPFTATGGVVGFNEEGTGLYMTVSFTTDTAPLTMIDPESGEVIETLAHFEKGDIYNNQVLFNEATASVDAVQYTYFASLWEVLNETYASDFAQLKNARPGTFKITSRSHNDRYWVVVYTNDTEPETFVLYDRELKKESTLFSSRPGLAKYTLANTQTVHVKVRDGAELVSYLTLPAGSKGKKLPMVLFVHGGPWARDTWGFSPWTQFWANRGYAVLQVNFRGSTGFGQQFLRAGFEQWGVGVMQHDLTDSVQWAVDQGIADPDKVAIFGGSYGGYATLAGLCFTPKLYTCGIDMFGPSNMQAAFKKIAPWRTSVRNVSLIRIGNVLDDAFNEKISPFFHADQVIRPVMIAQGANDPVTREGQSTMMVEALKKNNVPVEFALFEDEGHGFQNPANLEDFYGRAENFLKEHLGGRAQPR